MKKTVKVLSLVLALFILSGCMKLNVDCGIDDNYTAYLNYNLKMDIKELDNDVKLDVIAYFDDLVAGYKDNEFKVIDKSTGDKIDIKLTYEKTGSNYEEAYSNLKTILNDPKISFLLNTDMSTSAKEYEQGFTFNGETDVTKILGTSYYNTLPVTISNLINDGLKKSEINFSITLPQSKVVETNGKVKNESGNTTITFPVSLSEASKFNMTARLSLDDNKAVNGDINSLVKENKQTISLYKTLIPVISIVTVLLAGGLIYLIMKIRKNKQLEGDNIEKISEESHKDAVTQITENSLEEVESSSAEIVNEDIDEDFKEDINE